MDRYSTGSTISKHNIIDAFKVVELLTKDTLNKDSDDSSDSSDDISTEHVEKDEIVEITSKILEETLEDKKESKPVKKEEKQPTSNKVSLKEIDDRLMTIDDFLGDF